MWTKIGLDGLRQAELAGREFDSARHFRGIGAPIDHDKQNGRPSGKHLPGSVPQPVWDGSRGGMRGERVLPYL